MCVISGAWDITCTLAVCDVTCRACRLIPSPVRHAVTTPIIKLGPEFASLHDFQVRMAHIPDISDLEHLTVSGDVYFGRDVVIKVSPLPVCCAWRSSREPAWAMLLGF